MDVTEAVSGARKAFPEWSKTPVEKRIELLRKFSELVEQEKEGITSLIMKEMGKPRPEAETEIIDARVTVDHYSKEILGVKKKEIGIDQGALPETEGFVEFAPHGVIGIIMPWNYPFSLPLWTIVPALLAGNTLVFKPSELTPEVGKKIHGLLNQVLPEGVFNTVLGGEKAGKELVKSGIDKLFFTGSVEAGKDIMKNIGIKPLAMELGGKDALIVLEDADLGLAVKGAVWGAMNNSGQVCSSAERIYVDEKIAAEFTKRVVEEVNKLRKGKDVSSLVSREQFQKVQGHIRDAVSKGARVLCGGKGSGLFFEPTVLTGLKPGMKVLTEETFGPVLPIVKFRSEEEAVRMANDSRYGLGVTIWTRDPERGKKVGDRIDAGMVWINDVNIPFDGGDYWGGIKESGLTNTESKIMQCLKKKAFMVHSGKGKRDWWFPY